MSETRLEYMPDRASRVAVRVAYPVVYFAMIAVGFVTHLPFWLNVVIGVSAMVPVLVADWMITFRAKRG